MQILAKVHGWRRHLRLGSKMHQAVPDLASALLGPTLWGWEDFRQQELKRDGEPICYIIRFVHNELGNLKWSELPDVQIFISLYLGNGTRKEFKVCVVWRDNSRKETEVSELTGPTGPSSAQVGHEDTSEANPHGITRGERLMGSGD